MQAYQFLKECGTFWVTTIDKGRPASRPFGAVMERGGELYISTSATKAVYKQLKTNPAVQLTAIKPGTREWIRIDGEAVETSDLDAKAQMLKDCPPPAPLPVGARQDCLQGRGEPAGARLRQRQAHDRPAPGRPCRHPAGERDLGFLPRAAPGGR